MKKLTLAFFLITQITFSQILNVESLRKVTDTSGWSGAINLNLELKRNTNDFINLGSNIHIQYKMKKHLILFKNDVSFEKIEAENFDNSFVSHIRYNYRFHDKIAWEAFTQGQYNKINLINFRGLLGTGPRFKLSKSENYKFYLGTLVMYEYEEVDDGVTPIQRDVRNSSYLSFSLYPSENISFISTTYYQPNLSGISDYRISSQSSLLVSVFKNFALQINYLFTYDAFPAVGIPKSQYNFNTGFTYSFD